MQDIAHLDGGKGVHLTLAREAGPTVVDTADLVVHRPAALGHGADCGVQAGAVAAAGKYCYTQLVTSS